MGDFLWFYLLAGFICAAAAFALAKMILADNKSDRERNDDK